MGNNLVEVFRFKDLTLERVNVKLSLNNRITHEGTIFSLVDMAANPLTQSLAALPREDHIVCLGPEAAPATLIL